MEKLYMSVITTQNNEMIIQTNEGNSLLVSKNVVDKMSEFTNDEEEALSLLSYLKDRYEDYTMTGQAKFKCSEEFIDKLFYALLNSTLTPDRIVLALDHLSNFEIFGMIDEEEIESKEVSEGEVDDRVSYVCYRVCNELGCTYNVEDSARVRR